MLHGHFAHPGVAAKVAGIFEGVLLKMESPKKPKLVEMYQLSLVIIGGFLSGGGGWLNLYTCGLDFESN